MNELEVEHVARTTTRGPASAMLRYLATGALPTVGLVNDQDDDGIVHAVLVPTGSAKQEPVAPCPVRQVQPGVDGSRHPFHTLLAREIPALNAYARSFSRNEHRRQDLVQDTLAKAWASRAQFQPDTRLRAWLFTILRNTFFSDMRKSRREVEDVDGLFAAKLSTPPNQDHARLLSELVVALELLPPSQREALILVGGEGCSQEEVSVMHGCSLGTVKSRVNRARGRLREILGGADAV